MKMNSINPGWVFKTVGQEIETTTDMSVMALAVSSMCDDSYEPLIIKEGTFFYPNGKPFDGLVYAYIPCPIISYPDQRPVCIFHDMNAVSVVDAGRFPLRAGSTGVVLGDDSYRISHIGQDHNGKMYVSIESLAKLESCEQRRQQTKTQERTKRRGEQAARATVESNLDKIQLQVDAKVEELNARRMEVHPSFYIDFDIQLLKLSKNRTRAIKLARDVMNGHDLFTSLTSQINHDVGVFGKFFAESGRRFERDAWIEKTAKERGELICVSVAALASGRSVGTYRQLLGRMGVSVFACPFLTGGAGRSNIFITKKDADRLGVETDK
jgi:hypothetical protein